MERFNAAATLAAKVGFGAGVSGQPSIHGRHYEEIRERLGPSAGPRVMPPRLGVVMSRDPPDGDWGDAGHDLRGARVTGRSPTVPAARGAAALIGSLAGHLDRVRRQNWWAPRPNRKAPGSRRGDPHPIRFTSYRGRALSRTSSAAWEMFTPRW